MGWGREPLVFAGAMAVAAPKLQQLVALRMGEIHPPMLARHVATLDHILRGRLAVNIISSDLAGETLEAGPRYRRTAEVIQILRQCWTQDRVDFDGEFYKLKLPTTAPGTPFQRGGPLLYFGGISEHARAVCAEHCDVFLMWPETEENIAEVVADLGRRAARHGRVLDFGLRIHVIVRETEREAREYASKLISKLDGETETRIRQDRVFQYAGTVRQDALRARRRTTTSRKTFWSGIGRVRAGCGSAIVGDPDQVFDKLQRYIKLGLRSFILSGYPHLDECDLFARYVLPRLRTTRPVGRARQGRLLAAGHTAHASTARQGIANRRLMPVNATLAPRAVPKAPAALPLRAKTVLGVGGLPVCYGYNVQGMAISFYQMLLGVNPAMLGFALLIPATVGRDARPDCREFFRQLPLAVRPPPSVHCHGRDRDGHFLRAHLDGLAELERRGQGSLVHRDRPAFLYVLRDLQRPLPGPHLRVLARLQRAHARDGTLRRVV